MLINEEVKELIEKFNGFLRLGNKLHKPGIDEVGSVINPYIRLRPIKSKKKWPGNGRKSIRK